MKSHYEQCLVLRRSNARTVKKCTEFSKLYRGPSQIDKCEIGSMQKRVQKCTQNIKNLNEELGLET
jgi:hypothetical protein